MTVHVYKRQLKFNRRSDWLKKNIFEMFFFQVQICKTYVMRWFLFRFSIIISSPTEVFFSCIHSHRRQILLSVLLGVLNTVCLVTSVTSSFYN